MKKTKNKEIEHINGNILFRYKIKKRFFYYWKSQRKFLITPYPLLPLRPYWINVQDAKQHEIMTDKSFSLFINIIHGKKKKKNL